MVDFTLKLLSVYLASFVLVGFVLDLRRWLLQGAQDSAQDRAEGFGRAHH
jgi:hypothetical protein